MKRFIAILTLALTAALSADDASAQQANAVPLLALSMAGTAEAPLEEIGGMLMWTDSISNDGDYSDPVVPALLDLIADNDCIVYLWYDGFADWLSVLNGTDYVMDATPNSLDPSDCPNLGGQEGEDLVDLWCELLYAGYTEDEAFEMIEMVTGEDIAEPLPERLPVKSYEDMVTY